MIIIMIKNYQAKKKNQKIQIKQKKKQNLLKILQMKKIKLRKMIIKL